MEKSNAAVLVGNKDYVMLAKRRHGKDIEFGGFWAPFSGAVERGEQPFQAAERELLEETGIKIKYPLDFLIKYPGWRGIPFYLYLDRVADFPTPVLDQEHTEWGIFRTDTIRIQPNPIDPEIVNALALI